MQAYCYRSVLRKQWNLVFYHERYSKSAEKKETSDLEGISRGQSLEQVS